MAAAKLQRCTVLNRFLNNNDDEDDRDDDSSQHIQVERQRLKQQLPVKYNTVIFLCLPVFTLSQHTKNLFVKLFSFVEMQIHQTRTNIWKSSSVQQMAIVSKNRKAQINEAYAQC